MIIMLVTVCYATDKIINMNGDDKEGAEKIRNLAVSSRNAKQSEQDRKSTRLNSSHRLESRMPSSA